MTRGANLEVPMAEPLYESLAQMVGRWVEETPAALLGVLGAGGVLVAIDPRLPLLRQQLLAEQAGVKKFVWAGAPVLSWMASAAITVVHVVPSLARRWLIEFPAGLESSILRWSFFAGEPLADSLVTFWRERFPNGRLVNLYGPTETTLAKFYYIVPESPDAGVQPVGWPLPQTEGWLVENGEIAIRTPFRTRGYLNAPEDQASPFFANPRRHDPRDLIYRTGDRGRFRADGALEILGRLDQQVKIQGVRVEPDEVSAVMSRYPAVKACVVVARSKPGREPVLAAYVVALGVTEADLRGFLVGHLPAPMVPPRFMFLERLPLTVNGKVDRAALPAPLETPTLVEPKSQLERVLAEVWREVLGVEQIGLEDNFFEVGGNSLRLQQVHGRLKAVLKYDVPIIALFQYPTIRALAGWLERPAVRPNGNIEKQLNL